MMRIKRRLSHSQPANSDDLDIHVNKTAQKCTDDQGILSPNKIKSHALNRVDLFLATKLGRVDLIEDYFAHNYLLTSDACNRLDECDLSPLHYAARYDRVEIIETLIKYGADVNIRGYDNTSPVFMAVKHNAFLSLETLIKHNAVVSLKDSDGETPLHEASRLGFEDICKRLIHIDQSLVNEVDNDLLSPLHLACMRNKVEVCRLLIDRGSSITKKSIDGGTAFHHAAAKGAAKVVRMLLDAAGSCKLNIKDHINEMDNQQQTPLHKAAQGNHKEVIQLLVQSGANIRAIQRDGLTALHVAAANGYPDVVRKLILLGAPIEARDDLYRTPLHYTASHSHLTAAKALLDAGANIRHGDRKRRTSLMYAVSKGHMEMTKFLLDHGANITAVDDQNKSCLHIAVENSHTKVLNLLLSFSITALRLINDMDTFECTPLHYAVKKGNLEIVEVLLKSNAMGEINDGDDNSSLHIACMSGNARVVKLICRKYPSLLNCLGDRSKSPLHVAVSLGHASVVKTLLKFGGDVEKRDSSYLTPLEIAAIKGNCEIATILVFAGANVNLADYRGECPIHKAARKGNARMVKLLLDHGADITLRDGDGKDCMDIVIENDHEDVAMVLVIHKRAKAILKKVDTNGHTVFQNLIKRLPIVAKVMMDSCVVRTNENMKLRTQKVEYDFTYIDPGPDVEVKHCSNGKIPNTNALITMVQFRRAKLLKHPLSTKLLDAKWNRFGWHIYFFNLIVYVLFITSLSVCVIYHRSIYADHYFHRDVNIGLKLRPSDNSINSNSNHIASTVTIDPNDNMTDLNTTIMNNSRANEIAFKQTDLYLSISFTTVVVTFGLLNLVKEAYLLYLQRLRYFRDLSNYFENFLYIICVSTLLLGSNYNIKLTMYSVIVFVAYINLLQYIQRMKIFGIYVVMLKSMFLTIMKVSLIVAVLVMAFAMSFSLLDPSSKEMYTLPLAFVRVIDMMVGEINLPDVWFPRIEDGTIAYPRSVMLLINIALFVFFMPVMLINLMVGLAVGDVNKVQREAHLERLALQAEYFDDLERALPLVTRKKFHIPNLTYFPRPYWEKMDPEPYTPGGFLNNNGIDVPTVDNDQTERILDVQYELKDQRQKLDDLVVRFDSLQSLMIKLLKQNKEIIQSGDDVFSRVGEPIGEYGGNECCVPEADGFISNGIENSVGMNLRSSVNDLKSTDTSQGKILRKVKSQQSFKPCLSVDNPKKLNQRPIQPVGIDLFRQGGEMLNTIESSDSFDSECDFTVEPRSHSLGGTSNHDLASLMEPSSEPNLATYGKTESLKCLSRNENAIA